MGPNPRFDGDETSMWEITGTLARWSLFAGLLLSFGAVTFKVILLSRSAAGTTPVRDEEEDGPARFDPARTVAGIGVCAVLAAAAGSLGRLAAEMAVFRDPFELYSAELELLLTATSFGTAWIGQAAFLILGLLTFALARFGRGHARELGWVGAAGAVVLLVYTPAFSGHAAGAEHYVTAAISADVLHVAAGGAWLGTLGVMALVVLAARRAGDPISRPRLIDWIQRFSPIAMGSAIIIASTGIFGAWLHLDAFSSLWAHPYGQRLSLKILLLLVVAGCGGYNWKRSQGRVHTSGDPPRLPGTVMLELSAGLVLLLVTAVLVTTPPPAH